MVVIENNLERQRRESGTSNDTTASRRNSTRLYFEGSPDVAAFVGGMLPRLDRDSRLTMTMQRAKSEGSCVYFVTVSLSDVTGTPKSFDELPSI